MSKRQKAPAKHSPAPRANHSAPAASSAVAAAHPPAKSPSLLTASIVLFFLWFVFLLIAATWG